MIKCFSYSAWLCIFRRWLGGGRFVFSLLELRQAYTHYTPGMGMGWGYIMIPSSGWERKGWQHDGTWGGAQHLEARLEFT